MQKIKLPTEKQLNGMRFGQWLYNELDNRNRAIIDGKTYSWNTGLAKELFYISNKDLQKIINKLYK